MLKEIFFLFSMLTIISARQTYKRPDDKVKCPKVKAIRNFNLDQMVGQWYIIEYYASSEEALTYRCMRTEFTVSPLTTDVTMNFTYSFTDDPINEQLFGNITWTIPDLAQPAHWTHSEDTYEGVYNTYVLDSDYTTWALLLHCAEKSKVPRYLSSFIMSRKPVLGVNVVSYLRDKLPRYDIDLSYMFVMEQNDCNMTIINDLSTQSIANRLPITHINKHPLNHSHNH